MRRYVDPEKVMVADPRSGVHRDEDGIPAEFPMTYDQAELALLLGSILRQFRAERGLVWHIEVNDRIDELLDAAGKKDWWFPDLYVTCGIPQRERDSGPYRIWEVGRPPDFILEYAVKRYMKRDRVHKLQIYENLGVSEYFIFDTTHKKIPGLLEGYRLNAGGSYEPIPALDPSAPLHRLNSEQLRLDLAAVKEDLSPGGYACRAFLPGAIEAMPTEREALAQQALRDKEEALRDTEQALRQAREEIARLRRAAGLSP